MNAPRLLVLGTHNQKKGRELAELLRPHGLTVETLAAFSQAIEVEETGDTFGENARLKAAQQARRLGLWVLAEDSGIAIDAMDGRPGIYSARYAGHDATDETNNAQLILELAETPVEKRTAHYVCHAALADPTGEIRGEEEAYCRGRILFEAAGASGFGYDPLFEVLEYHRTFGQLGDYVKAAISHRARAMRRITPLIVRCLLEQTA